LFFQPAWCLLESIASSARLLASELDFEHLKRQQVNKKDENAILSSRSKRDNCIKEFVGNQVTYVLNKLYSKLHEEETKLYGGETKIKGSEAIVAEKYYYQNWMRLLYPDGHLVGPLGERPLHVCALMAARFRLGCSDAEDYGVRIAEGIVQGIKSFHDNGNLRQQSELHAAYGKDYVAAVGHLLKLRAQQYQGMKDEIWTMGLPFVNDQKEWRIAKNLPTGSAEETRSKQGDHRRGGPENREKHIDCMLTKGLYEGETLFFPFIASGDDEAVDWLVDVDSREPLENRSLPSWICLVQRALAYAHFNGINNFGSG
jgi:hypothetical protein